MSDDASLGHARATNAPERSARAEAADAPRREGDPDAAIARGQTTRSRWPLRWLVDDVGLKVVALVLAFTTWVLVHDQLKIERTVEGVAVASDELPPTVRAHLSGLPRVRVRLSGTAASVESARQALEQSGRPLRLRSKEFVGDSGQMVFGTPAEFTFPFSDAGVVESLSPPVRLDWHRIATQEIEVARPTFTVGGRTDLEVVTGQSTLEPGKVVVTGPIGVIESLRDGVVKLVPDDVDAVPWLKSSPDFATPFAWSSGFSAWRSRAPELRAEWLVTIDPPSVSGKAKFRENKTTSAQVELSLLYPAGLDARAYEPYDVKILDTGYDPKSHRLEISVRGDPGIVAGLGAGQSGWTLLVNLPPPPKDDKATVESVPATVVLVPPESAAGETSPRLRLVSPTKLFVTLERRKGS